MDCRQAQDLIAPYFLGALEPEERSQYPSVMVTTAPAARARLILENWRDALLTAPLPLVLSFLFMARILF